MVKARRKQLSLLLVIIALFLLVSVGYAFLSKELKIDGVTKVDSMSLNVKFTNAEYHSSESNTTGICNGELSNDDETFTFNARLKEFGEYCVYSVDVKNFGTIPAKISFNSSDQNWNGKKIPYIKEDSNTFFGMKVNPEYVDSSYCSTDSYNPAGSCQSDYKCVDDDYNDCYYEYTCEDGFTYLEDYLHFYDDSTYCYRMYNSFDQITLAKNETVRIYFMYNFKTDATVTGEGSTSDEFIKNYELSLVSRQGSLTASQIQEYSDYGMREDFKGTWRG